jgi:hypothetical protein
MEPAVLLVPFLGDHLEDHGVIACLLEATGDE